MKVTLLLVNKGNIAELTNAKPVDTKIKKLDSLVENFISDNSEYFMLKDIQQLLIDSGMYWWNGKDKNINSGYSRYAKQTIKIIKDAGYINDSVKNTKYKDYPGMNNNSKIFIKIHQVTE